MTYSAHSSARALALVGMGAMVCFRLKHACLYISAVASIVRPQHTCTLALSVCVVNYKRYKSFYRRSAERSQYHIVRVCKIIVLAATARCSSQLRGSRFVKREEKDRATNRLWRISILTATMPVSLEEGYHDIIIMHAQLHLGSNGKIQLAFVCSMRGARFVVLCVVLCCVAACFEQ